MAESQPWQIFNGKWQIEQSENFEDYLKEMGVNIAIRKIAANAKGQFDIKVDGDKIVILFISTFMKSQPNTFHVNSGVETEASFEGRKCQAKTNWENGKLVVKIRSETEKDVKPQTITREIINDELVQTMQIGDIVAKRICKRIP